MQGASRYIKINTCRYSATKTSSLTEESALRINILEKKHKREVAAAAQVIDKVDWAHKQAKNIVASIIGDTNPTAERMSVRFSQDQEDVA